MIVIGRKIKDLPADGINVGRDAESSSYPRSMMPAAVSTRDNTNMKLALQMILLLGLVGLVASGILVYQDLSAHGCALCKIVPRHDLILGYPSCYYACGLFALIAVLAVFGLRSKR